MPKPKATAAIKPNAVGVDVSQTIMIENLTISVNADDELAAVVDVSQTIMMANSTMTVEFIDSQIELARLAAAAVAIDASQTIMMANSSISVEPDAELTAAVDGSQTMEIDFDPELNAAIDRCLLCEGGTSWNVLCFACVGKFEST